MRAAANSRKESAHRNTQALSLPGRFQGCASSQRASRISSSVTATESSDTRPQRGPPGSTQRGADPLHDAPVSTTANATGLATSSADGDATRFSVRNLPDPASVRVQRDGGPHAGWRVSGPDSIEIETRVGTRAYELYTGYRGRAGSRSPERSNAAVAAASAARGGAIRARATLGEVAAAVASASASAASCPCCTAAV